MAGVGSSEDLSSDAGICPSPCSCLLKWFPGGFVSSAAMYYSWSAWRLMLPPVMLVCKHRLHTVCGCSGPEALLSPAGLQGTYFCIVSIRMGNRIITDHASDLPVTHLYVLGATITLFAYL